MGYSGNAAHSERYIAGQRGDTGVVEVRLYLNGQKIGLSKSTPFAYPAGETIAKDDVEWMRRFAGVIRTSGPFPRFGDFR